MTQYVLANLASKADTVALRADIKADIADLNAELKTEIAQGQAKIYSAMSTATFAIIATFVALNSATFAVIWITVHP